MNRAPSTRGPSTLKSVSRSRSLVGRVAVPRGASSTLDRNSPAITRIFFRLSEVAPHPYNGKMLRASFPIGRVSFPLLLALAIGYSVAATGSASRGIGLWLALCFAVLVRECARAVAAAHAGLRPRAVFLLPVGGLMAFSSAKGAPPPASTRVFHWIGPIANLAAGLLILGASYALVPQVSLLAQPWISLGHILRSVVWTQIILGVVSLLPMPRLPERAAEAIKETPNRSTILPASLRLKQLPTIGLGTILAVLLMMAGVFTMTLWPIVLGAFMMLGTQISTAHQAATTAGAETIFVREVMLTELTLLSTSDTLQIALDRSVHSLQEVFPVVRGSLLVGAISRQTIASRLLIEGDSYLQGLMTRQLPFAQPEDKLVDTLRHASNHGGGEFIPVVENDVLIGILTPQSLSRAVQQVKLLRARSGRETQS
jgi:predicted transcriptional regulator